MFCISSTAKNIFSKAVSTASEFGQEVMFEVKKQSDNKT